MKTNHLIILFSCLLFSCRKQTDVDFYEKQNFEEKKNTHLPHFNKLYGGSSDDIANAIIKANDCGYVVAGSTRSNDGDVTSNNGFQDIWIVKIDDKGTKLWQKTFGGSSFEAGNSIVACNDGYIVAGTTFSNDGDVSGNHGSVDAWLLKLNNNGDLQWKKTIGSTGFDGVESIIQSSDGGYILAGSTSSTDVPGFHGSADGWVVKIDGSGNVIWQRALGGSEYDGLYSIIPASDGGYVATGFISSSDGDVTGFNGATDAWVVKLNKNGKIEWQKSLKSINDETGISITGTTDGGYIMAGSIYLEDSPGVLNDYIWLLKLDKRGNIKWERTLGGSGFEQPKKITSTLNGHYIVQGFTYSNDGDFTGNHGGGDAFFIKIDNHGNIKWKELKGGSGDEYAMGITDLKKGGYLVAGQSSSNDGDLSGNHGAGDAWIFYFR